MNTFVSEVGDGNVYQNYKHEWAKVKSINNVDFAELG